MGKGGGGGSEQRRIGGRAWPEGGSERAARRARLSTTTDHKTTTTRPRPRPRSKTRRPRPPRPRPSHLHLEDLDRGREAGQKEVVEDLRAVGLGVRAEEHGGCAAAAQGPDAIKAAAESGDIGDGEDSRRGEKEGERGEGEEACEEHCEGEARKERPTGKTCMYPRSTAGDEGARVRRASCATARIVKIGVASDIGRKNTFLTSTHHLPSSWRPHPRLPTS
jgi:hypothetical protein